MADNSLPPLDPIVENPSEEGGTTADDLKVDSESQQQATGGKGTEKSCHKYWMCLYINVILLIVSIISIFFAVKLVWEATTFDETATLVERPPKCSSFNDLSIIVFFKECPSPAKKKHLFHFLLWSPRVSSTVDLCMLTNLKLIFLF